jgi:hypothetical protein
MRQCDLLRIILWKQKKKKKDLILVGKQKISLIKTKKKNNFAQETNEINQFEMIKWGH